MQASELEPETAPLLGPDGELEEENQDADKMNENQPSQDGTKSFEKNERVDIILRKAQDLAEREQEKRNEKKGREQFRKVMFTYTSASDRCLIYFAYLAAMISGTIYPISTILVGEIMSELTSPNPNTQLILNIGILLAVVALCIFAMMITYNYILDLQSFKITRSYQIEYLRALLRQDVKWFDDENASQLQVKMIQEIEAINKTAGRITGFMLQVVGVFLFGLSYAIYSSYLMTIILLIYLPIFGILSAKLRKNATIGVNEAMKAYSKSAGFADQALNSIKVVCAFGQENTEIDNFNFQLEKASLKQKEAVPKLAVGYGAFAGFYTLLQCYTYTFIAILVLLELINPITGEPYDAIDLWVISVIVSFSTGFIFELFPYLKLLSEGQVAAKEAFKIIEKQPRFFIKDQSKISISKQENFRGRIEFRNVTFTYKQTPVLKNFTAVFEAGKTTAIVGRSGQGKSTIISLIERFYDVDQGEILIDGINIKDLNLDDLRKLIGYVGQEPVLFNTTIRKNLLYANPQASEEELIQALRLSNVYRFIETELKKDGIDTQVGNAGTQISGGQKQRIAIARALIKHSRILLLDEATSALDSRTEKEVQQAIEQAEEALGSITTVVVAHRLSTIRNADKIIVLEDGNIKEEGSHEELLRVHPDGVYSQMVKEQNKLQQIDEEIMQDEPGLKDLSDSKSEERQSSKEDEQSLYHQQLVENTQKKYTFKEKRNRLLGLTKTSLVFASIASAFFISAYFPTLAINQSNALLGLEGVYGEDQQLQIVVISIAIFLILAIYYGLFRYIARYSTEEIGVDVSKKIRSQLYSSILSKSMDWFDIRDNSPGTLNSIMARDATVIKSVGVDALHLFTQLICTLLLTLILSSLFCWQVAISVLVFYPLVFTSVILVHVSQRKLELLTKANSKEANLLLGDFIINYRTVAALSNQETMISDYDQFIVHQSDSLKYQVFQVAVANSSTRFVIATVQALVLIYSSILLNYNQDINSDGVFKAILILFTAFSGLSQQTAFVADLSEANSSSDRIFEIIDSQTKINPLLDTQNPVNYRQSQVPNLKPIQGEIEFRKVWFRYPSRPDCWVLRNFSMKVYPNQSVALVGESGCGKSTIVQLLLRFYDVNDGQILLDGIDIRDYPLADLRRYMGLVQQEPTLFTYSLYENILYGNGIASNSDILEVSKKAYVSEFIQKFKDENELENIGSSYKLLREELEKAKEQIIARINKEEYEMLYNEITALEQQQSQYEVAIDDSEGVLDHRDNSLKDIELPSGFYKGCGIKGNRLSGGQKQRVAIARAIIRNPYVLLLDEATSSLDEESQAIVQKAIDELMGERTTIVIAHRLSTVENCQRILMIKKGRVVEEGTIQELKRKPNSYYNVFASQAL